MVIAVPGAAARGGTWTVLPAGVPRVVPPASGETTGWMTVVDGGAGWMVSHAAPVNAGGRFFGVVGTDILLSGFAQLLDRLSWSVGALALVNDRGQVLAVWGEEPAEADPATGLGRHGFLRVEEPAVDDARLGLAVEPHAVVEAGGDEARLGPGQPEHP